MRTLLTLTLALGVSSCTSSNHASDTVAPEPAAEATYEVVLTSEVEFDQLNPARGDRSPMAGDLRGDRKSTGATGYLLKTVEDFRSPPHVHNVRYRAVVISGLWHNDDPNAADMWMPTGSFWTQPKGELHITATKGGDTLGYIEIEEGPYLVYPSDEKFDDDERAVNVHESNLVWVDQPGMPASANGPKVAYLWGKPRDAELNGTFVKLPDGFTGTMRANTSTFGAVVIQGRPTHKADGEPEVKNLEPGSHVSSEGDAAHQVSCEAGDDCIFYVRMEGKLDVIPAQAKK